MVAAEETRKGPWTEEEDMQLVCFVGLFGERRWDFIAKVSGLHRTGKSCRLRWVNYLHPGLKRGRMSPQEERLILELHARWGNRWSRIARRLPGRTDNEIKNYWRTHMRKKAQERKRNALASSSCTSTSTSTSTSSSASSSVTKTHAPPGPSPADTWLSDGANAAKDEAYPMERIWEEIASAEAYANRAPPLGASPSLWDCCADPLWKVVEGADGGQHLWWDPPV